MSSASDSPCFAPFEKSIIYQIYPSSFNDSNGDGFGDLNGITAKLDHLEFLGVDYIWICPIYKSPLRDMGYDISGYKTIDPRYGSLEDWDLLAHELKKRNIGVMYRYVVDVVNTDSLTKSFKHPWFLSSRSSRTDPKRDWYVWRPARYTETGERLEPNNWVSEFGGSAWEWDEATEEYYLHLYDVGQPDLNWENPDVRDAVYEIMEWWIARGCAGFRMDVINKISKVPGLPDAPISNINGKYQLGRELYVNGPRVHEFIQEMHQRVISKYPSIITIGETPFTHDAAEVVKYVQPERKELNMVFVFELQILDQPSHTALISQSFVLPAFKHIIARWQTYMQTNNGWNTVFLENHDMARSVSRYLPLSSDSPTYLKSRGAKLLAMLCCTLSGTLFVYQGQEIGMSNVPSTWDIEMFRDVASLNYYRELLARRTTLATPHPDMSNVIEGIRKKGRDNARTPMQWSSVEHAGFTTATANVEPWISVNSNYLTCNVEQQRNDPISVLHFWKDLIRLRKDTDCLITGIFTLLSPEHLQVFAYTRVLNSTIFLIVLNFSTEEVEYVDSIRMSSHIEMGTALPEIFAECLASNVMNSQARPHPSAEAKQGINLQSFKIRLAPLEGRIYGVSKQWRY